MACICPGALVVLAGRVQDVLLLSMLDILRYSRLLQLDMFVMYYRYGMITVAIHILLLSYLYVFRHCWRFFEYMYIQNILKSLQSSRRFAVGRKQRLMLSRHPPLNKSWPKLSTVPRSGALHREQPGSSKGAMNSCTPGVNYERGIARLGLSPQVKLWMWCFVLCMQWHCFATPRKVGKKFLESSFFREEFAWTKGVAILGHQPGQSQHNQGLQTLLGGDGTCPWQRRGHNSSHQSISFKVAMCWLKLTKSLYALTQSCTIMPGLRHDNMWHVRLLLVK